MTDIEKRAEEIGLKAVEQEWGLPDVPQEEDSFREAVRMASIAARLALESLQAEVKKARREALEELLQYFEQKAAEARAKVRRALTQADKDARMEEACWYEGVAYQVRKRIDAPVPTSRPQGGLRP